MDNGNSPSSLREIIKAIEVIDAASAEAIETVDDDRTVSMVLMDNKQYNVYVKILEQPVDSIRFRYKSEEKSTSIIPGINSTLKKKTFPSIQIEGYEGRAVVVLSCVTEDSPYRPHPHNLVGKKCKQGICTIEISAGNIPKIVTFSNLGIQCVKKKDIEEALKERQALRIDPFQTGFEHRRHPINIDLNAVRLCFQVFLEGSQKGKFVSLLPLKSNIIYEIRTRPPLVLHELSHNSATVAGGLKMMLFCEKVAEKDIQVRFFEEDERGVVWEEIIDSESIHVHKQVAIRFETPKYRLQEVGIYPIRVQLRRPSDQTMSNSLPFEMFQLSLGTDQSSNGAEVDPSGVGISTGSFLQPARSSHNSLEIVRTQALPEGAPSSMEWNTEDDQILMETQQQRYQPNDSPMMSLSEVSASTNTQLFPYADYQPNLFNNMTPEIEEEMQLMSNIEVIEGMNWNRYGEISDYSDYSEYSLSEYYIHTMQRKVRSLKCLFSADLAEKKDFKYQKCSAEKNFTEIPPANLPINLSGLSISDSIKHKVRSFECLFSIDFAEKKEDLKYRKSLTEENLTDFFCKPAYKSLRIHL